MSYDELKEYEQHFSFGTEKREPAEYCTVLVDNGYFKIGDFGVWNERPKKWYWMLEGEEIFCEIRRYGKRIYDYMPVELTKTRVRKGRGIAPEDCFIV